MSSSLQLSRDNIYVRQLSKPIMPVIYEQTSVGIKEGYSDITKTCQLINAGSTMIGYAVTKVELYASTNSGTISGNATCTIENSGGTTVATIGTADTSTLTSATPTDYTLTFENTENTYELTAGDRVVVSWGDGSDPPSILWLWRSDGSTVANTEFQYYTTSWYSRSGDMSGRFTSQATPTSTGTRLPPPPIVVTYF